MYKIYLDNVSYIYSRGTPFEQKALDGVTLGIREGCITGIIGHTGSGKSTMMQLFNGLAEPTEGKVYLDACDIHLTLAEALASKTAFPEYAALSGGARKRRSSVLCLSASVICAFA